jgi:hypothetical protein
MASGTYTQIGRVALIILFVISIYVAVRQGIAGWYFEKHVPQDVETAAKWDPRDPQFPDALADLMRFYSENPNPAPVVQLCEKAVQLSPNDANYWADLGAAYDWAGRPNDALHAFERAHALFPNSPDINWSLANFYVRVGRVNDSLPLLQKVLVEGGIDQNQIFALATRATDDPEAVVSKVLPARAPFPDRYLEYLIGANKVEQAKIVWGEILKSNEPFSLPTGVMYVNGLIQRLELDDASDAWSELTGRFPAQMNARLTKSNLVTDGDFNAPILNGGFDWRVFPIEGATVSILPANSGASGFGLLQIEFDGSHNVEYGHVLQFIRVDPKTQYQFSGEIRTRGITTDSGPRFQVYDAHDMSKVFVSTENRVGTCDWWTEKLSFRTGSETRLVVLRVARPSSSKFDNKIAGDVWIRHISLAEVTGVESNGS